MIRMNPYRRQVRKSNRPRRGIAAVEFALISPVLFVIAFGMIEIGSLMMIKNSLTQASRSGARTASLPMSTLDEVYAKVREELQVMNLGHADITVIPETLSAIPPGGNVTIQIRVNPSTVAWVPQFLKLPLTEIVAETTMRREST